MNAALQLWRKVSLSSRQSGAKLVEVTILLGKRNDKFSKVMVLVLNVSGKLARDLVDQRKLLKLAQII